MKVSIAVEFEGEPFPLGWHRAETLSCVVKVSDNGTVECDDPHVSIAILSILESAQFAHFRGSMR